MKAICTSNTQTQYNYNIISSVRLIAGQRTMQAFILNNTKAPRFFFTVSENTGAQPLDSKPCVTVHISRIMNEWMMHTGPKHTSKHASDLN